MQDKQIVDLFLKRDESAITATAEKYERYISKIAYNILADEEDAKETVNDTYLAAWNSIPPNEPETLSTYLVKLTRRISIDKLRTNTRKKRIPSEYTVSIDELGDVVSNEDSAESEFEAKLLSEAINAFVKSLPEIKKNIFVSRYYFHDSVKDVSQTFGIGEEKVKGILFRTRKALKEYLLKEGFEL